MPQLVHCRPIDDVLHANPVSKLHSYSFNRKKHTARPVRNVHTRSHVPMYVTFFLGMNKSDYAVRVKNMHKIHIFGVDRNSLFGGGVWGVWGVCVGWGGGAGVESLLLLQRVSLCVCCVISVHVSIPSLPGMEMLEIDMRRFLHSALQ